MLLTTEKLELNSQSEPPQTPQATKKILHVINGEHFSGAERVQDLLAIRLPDFGYTVGFACVKPGKFPEVRRSIDSELFELPMRSRLDFICVKRVIELYRQHGYSALHAHTPRTLLIARLAADRLQCPLFYHVHSPVGRDSDRSLANRINTWLETWSLKRVTQMICVSRSLRSYMKELGHPEDKLCVVSNGVATIDEIPHRRIPGTSWVLGVMALFRPRKGLEVLLDAVQILKQRGTKIRIRAVGPFETRSYQKEILKRVDELGIGELIDWTGFQADVNQQLQKMDVFVLPSLYGEGLPMVVLEAMANAVPVVASRVEGIPEAVRDGVDGLICQPGNAASLADCLQEMVADIRRWKTMSRSSYDRQRRELSDISMSKGLAAVYDSVLSTV